MWCYFTLVSIHPSQPPSHASTFTRAWYIKITGTFRNAKGAYADAEFTNREEIDKNGKAAMDSFLFGREKNNDSRRGGIMELEHMPKKDYSQKLVPNFLRFIRQCMSSRVAQQAAVTEEDVCVMLVVDFASLGSLKVDHLRNVLHVHSNLLGQASPHNCFDHPQPLHSNKNRARGLGISGPKRR